MSDWVVTVLFPIVGTLILILLGGNMWFIRRLVVKIDSVEKMVDQRLPVQQNEIKNLNDKITQMGSAIDHLSQKIEDFGHIRERVAVLESQKRGKGVRLT